MLSLTNNNGNLLITIGKTTVIDIPLTSNVRLRKKNGFTFIPVFRRDICDLYNIIKDMTFDDFVKHEVGDVEYCHTLKDSAVMYFNNINNECDTKFQLLLDDESFRSFISTLYKVELFCKACYDNDREIHGSNYREVTKREIIEY